LPYGDDVGNGDCIGVGAAPWPRFDLFAAMGRSYRTSAGRATHNPAVWSK